MGVLIPFPLTRCIPREPDSDADPEAGHTAAIIILPVVRIERMVAPPPLVTPNGPKKRRKRA